MPPKPRVNRQDLTLRNLHALHKKYMQLSARIREIERRLLETRGK